MSLAGFDESEWEQLKQLGPLLRYFRRHTDSLQGSSYVTIDRVIPSLIQLDIFLSRVSSRATWYITKTLIN